MDIDNKNEKIDSSNIFDEFTKDSTLKEEIDKIEQEQQRDSYYYFKKASSFLQFSVIILIILSIFLWGYIYIQNNTNFKNNSLLTPICYLFLGNINNSTENCSSVSSLIEQYNNDISTTKDTQLSKINEIFENVYKIENILNSKEIVFLKNKTESKLSVLDILNSFDELLKDFEPIEKEKIKCFDIEISNNYTMKVTCEAYSTLFEKTIKGFDGTNQDLVGGTSISYASSFINYIKTQSNKFFVLSEDETLGSTPLLLENNGFTSKTTFNLELQYNTNNITF